MNIGDKVQVKSKNSHLTGKIGKITGIYLNGLAIDFGDCLFILPSDKIHEHEVELVNETPVLR